MRGTNSVCKELGVTKRRVHNLVCKKLGFHTMTLVVNMSCTRNWEVLITCIKN